MKTTVFINAKQIYFEARGQRRLAEMGFNDWCTVRSPHGGPAEVNNLPYRSYTRHPLRNQVLACHEGQRASARRYGNKDVALDQWRYPIRSRPQRLHPAALRYLPDCREATRGTSLLVRSYPPLLHQLASPHRPQPRSYWNAA